DYSCYSADTSGNGLF
nr:immunoglobulin light chain junction region [Macaca mulatta]